MVTSSNTNSIKKLTLNSQAERHYDVIDTLDQLHSYIQYTYQDMKTSLSCLMVKYISNSCIMYLYNHSKFAGEMEIPLLLDNGYIFSIIANHFYDAKEILHRYLKIPEDNMMNKQRYIYLIESRKSTYPQVYENAN